MLTFPRVLNRFRRDESGAFAVIFGVIAVVLVALSGAAVDFSLMQQVRTRAQVALDAAALALQPSIYTTAASTIQGQAQALLVNRLADPATSWAKCTDNSYTPPCAFVTSPVLDTTNGQLTLRAELRIPTYFVSLVGVGTIPAQIVSVATRKKLNLEVAMVLDNSGSMYYTMGYNSHINNTSPTRMNTLVSSATCATNILFYGVSSCSASTAGLTANASVNMAVVPFTQEVNVDAANAGATWLDRSGAASITRNNFDSDDDPTNTFSGTVDRISLFSGIRYNNAALSWGGCVEARKNPYDTDDTPPSSTTPDTLYTPYFAPDEPGNQNSAGSSISTNGDTFRNSYLVDNPSACTYAPPSCVVVQTKTNCSNPNRNTSSTFGNCTSTASAAYTLTIRGTVTNPTNCSYVTDQVSSTDSSTGSSPNITWKRTITYASNRALQERKCKYTNSTMNSAASRSYVYGPNGDCPVTAVVPLTNSPSSILTAITNMGVGTPQGGTNITEGSVWGWHVLSPNSPFTSKGGPYDNATSKVLIIMTDGENTISPGSNMNSDSYYSAYGFPWNNRLGVVSSSASTLEGVMNTRLSTICTNAKSAGIVIYTIGVDVADTTDPTGNRTLLTNCATRAANAYFPNTASDLQAAFVDIANQLSALRLSQ